MCGSRKYPSPPLPPPRNFQFSFILPFKILAFESPLPLEFPMIFLGVGVDIFWNHAHNNK